MSLLLEQLPLEQAHLSVNIQISASINVTAFSARQKVTGFVADEISTHMHGGTPMLFMGERIYWRVPVILSLPPIGDRGPVGEIDVDVETGQIIITPALLEGIIHRAELLAAHSSLSTETKR
jgi:hypothetical protein